MFYPELPRVLWTSLRALNPPPQGQRKPLCGPWTHLAASLAHVLPAGETCRHATAHTELAVLPRLGESLVGIPVQPLLLVLGQLWGAVALIMGTLWLLLLLLCLLKPERQCCRSMTCWCGSRSGSGSADPCIWLMDPGSGFGSWYFHQRPSRHQQKTNLKKSFSVCYFLKVHFHHFQRYKVKKSHKKVEIMVFLTVFAWW
jgi:hypothetical protein